MIKAFMVYSGFPSDGCQLVFAETANKAKSMCVGHLQDWDYVDMNCRRMPRFDEFVDSDYPYLVDDNIDLPKDAPRFYADIDIELQLKRKEHNESI